jgi:Terpene cyclase DEP1
VNRKSIYLFLCALGVALPYSQFIPWLMENGLHIGLLFRQLFANRIGGFFGLDVLVSSVVLVGFIRAEGKRLGVRLLWLPIAGLLTVGVSFALPFFLYLRERALEAREAPAKS